MFRSRLIALSAVAVLSLSACGGASENAAPAADVPAQSASGIDLILAAADQANQAETARVTMDLSSNGQSLTKGTGAINLVTGNGSITMSVEGMNIEMLMVDGDYFMKLPPDMAAGFEGKSWMRITLADLGSTGASVDPNSSKDGLDMLTGLNDDVQTIGKEEINGVSVTHYRGTVNFSDAQVPDNWAPEKVASLKERFGTDTPMNVYIDDEGQLRRASFDFTDPTTSQVINVVEDFSDFGVDVNTAKPDEASVINYSEVMASIPQ